MDAQTTEATSNPYDTCTAGSCYCGECRTECLSCDADVRKDDAHAVWNEADEYEGYLCSKCAGRES